MTDFSPLTALSPLDGRYYSTLGELRPIFSEYGLIKRRVFVEVAWLKALAANPQIPEIPPLDDATIEWLDSRIDSFTQDDAQRVKALEATTNHDVKAVEYWIKEVIAPHPNLNAVSEFVHFACTSEDINNLAYALMLQDSRRDVIAPALYRLIGLLGRLASEYADLAMLARTHGQAATPTTLGKELANVAARLEAQLAQFNDIVLFGKMNGAVGNYNAHHIAYPDIDWPAFSNRFIDALDLAQNPLTTQIEPHDFIAAYCHALSRLNTIILDLDRDIWSYIAIGYFRQKMVAGETGSSTMPHKINPIDFENAEGNVGMANALLAHLAAKLPVSRWQRDLSDSTVLRNLGVAMGYTLLGITSTLKGMNKLDVDEQAIGDDLSGAFDVLAEAVQTVMRRYGHQEPYEQLKRLTRGRGALDRATLAAFIDGLDLPDDVKQRLKTLMPNHYTGYASQLARQSVRET